MVRHAAIMGVLILSLGAYAASKGAPQVVHLKDVQVTPWTPFQNIDISFKVNLDGTFGAVQHSPWVEQQVSTEVVAIAGPWDVAPHGTPRRCCVTLRVPKGSIPGDADAQTVVIEFRQGDVVAAGLLGWMSMGPGNQITLVYKGGKFDSIHTGVFLGC